MFVACKEMMAVSHVSHGIRTSGRNGEKMYSVTPILLEPSRAGYLIPSCSHHAFLPLAQVVDVFIKLCVGVSGCAVCGKDGATR